MYIILYMIICIVVSMIILYFIKLHYFIFTFLLFEGVRDPTLVYDKFSNVEKLLEKVTLTFIICLFYSCLILSHLIACYYHYDLFNINLLYIISFSRL